MLYGTDFHKAQQVVKVWNDGVPSIERTQGRNAEQIFAKLVAFCNK